MNGLDALVGTIPALLALRSQVDRLLARQTAGRDRLPPLLILGETGVGKGFLVRAVHRASSRRDAPLVEVNCAAIPESLVEAELFGFERGAFTDARQAKPGLFQAAHRGVLFLDEIGTLPLTAQAKLLTVLDQQQVRRLGATRSEVVDVWILSATNEDLAAAVAAGRFRVDLYHRISPVTLQLPPLRERVGDVLELAQHFLRRACADYGLPDKRLTPETQAVLLAYSWPGNVRELANVMERVALLTDASEIAVESLGLPLSASPRPAGPGGWNVDGERERVLGVLEATQWNLSKAAAQLGVPRNTLRYRIEKLGLRRADAVSRAGEPGADTRATPQTAEPPVGGLRWERRWVAALRIALSTPPDVSGFHVTPVLEALVSKAEHFGAKLDDLHPLGFTALFGLEPMEDAATRAVFAAQAFQKAVERTAPMDGTPMRVDSAVHVAECLIARGAAVPGMDPAEKRRIDERLDLLLHAAPVESTVVSREAAKFVERTFELEALGGEQDPGGLRVVQRPRAGFEIPGRGRSPFVGRARELAQLDDFLTQAESGHGQVVGLVGEPGVGKSRLLYEFRHGVGPERVAYLEGRCASYGSTTPYLPITALARQAFGFAEADAPDTIGERVAEGVRALGLDPDLIAPYVTNVLGGKDDKHAVSPLLSPEAVRSRTMEALRQVTLAGSHRRPLIIAIEDLQWIDPTSEEALRLLADSVAAYRILLLLAYRHGYQPPWLGKSYASQVVLRRLGRADSLAIVQSTTSASTLTPALADSIVARADGVPFFLEELARVVVDRGEPDLAIPDTIQGAVSARLDRLPLPEKAVLQAAAVLGKEGPVDVLRHVAGLPEIDFGRALTRLRADEFLHETTVVPSPQYTFEHVLTQEVAYRDLVRDRRRALHAAAAAAIERLMPRTVERTPELLAHHATEAGLVAQAIDYWHRAGQLAVRRSAHVEAVAHLAKGLELVAGLPDTRARDQQELMLRLGLVSSLIATRGEASAQVDGTLVRARELVHRLGEAPQHFPVRYGLWRLSMARAHLHAAEEAAVDLLGIAERAADPALTMAANVAMGSTMFYQGQFARARSHFERSLDLHQPEFVRAQVLLYGQDLEAGALGYLGWTEAIMGRPDRAARCVDRGLDIARRAGHAFTLAFALLLAGMVRQLRREPALTEGLGQELLALSREQEFVYFVAIGLNLTGWAAAAAGDTERGLAIMRDGVHVTRELKHRLGLGYRTHLAESLARAGIADEALDSVEGALAYSRETGEGSFEADLCRIRGEILALLSRPVEAQAELEHAFDLASRQGASLFALRAATALTRLLAGSPAELAARARLAATYASFTEGQGLEDLLVARRLLETHDSGR